MNPKDLKRYYRLVQVNLTHVLDRVSVVNDDLTSEGPLETGYPDDLDSCHSTFSPVSVLVLDVSKALRWDQRASLQDVLSSFEDVFSESPGCTPTLKHDIILTTTNRITAKNYPVPIHLTLIKRVNLSSN